ncbi:MAG TPA: hypothetical protein VME70_02590 [Mycobacteriales bacterium]|nr:hypothetical protein [Mycobacteriales bacterium]
MFEADLRVPSDGLLLHIGPHKTGTTTIQGALLNAREAMVAHDVIYAGRTRQHQMAALAVTGGNGLRGSRPARRTDWDLVVAAARRADQQRVIVSSEYFDDATDDVARRVVRELGDERVHVVVTLRPLALILPSAWQQYVRNQMRMSYPRWLDVVLNDPDRAGRSARFWYRHHHDVLVERWASIVGPERLLVVVVDESDRESLLRTFERLVDLPTGLLRPEEGWTNRSLTAAEIELIRAINVEFHNRDLPATLYYDLVYEGIVRQMQLRTPEPDEPRITTPAWAVEQANAIAAAAATRIAESGVRVLGDLASLSAVKPVPDDRQTSLKKITVGIKPARDALLGAILTSGAMHTAAIQSSAPWTINEVRTSALMSEFAHRVASRGPERARALAVRASMSLRARGARRS